MKKIIQFNYQELWPNEYVELFKLIIAVTEKHNPEELHLTKAVEKVKRHVADVNKLKMVEDGFTKKFVDLDNRRDNLTISLFKIATLWTKTNLTEMVKNGQVIIDWLNRHQFENMSSAAYNDQTKRTEELLEDAGSSKEISEAINALSLDALVNELKSVNTYFDYHYKKFLSTGHKSEEGLNYREIRFKADMDIRGLFGYIEMYQNNYYFSKLDYEPLVNELNELLITYKTKLDKRKDEAKRANDLNPDEVYVTE